MHTQADCGDVHVDKREGENGHQFLKNIFVLLKMLFIEEDVAAGSA